MSHVTLQLPETLYRHLASQAQREGVSLQEYLVYALTRQCAHSYAVHVVSENAVAHQQAQFAAVLDALGLATPAALTAALAAREPCAPEPDLTPDVIMRLQARLARTSPPGTPDDAASTCVRNFGH